MICSITYCENKTKAHGLCNKHYIQQRRGRLKKFDMCVVDGCSYKSKKLNQDTGFCGPHQNRFEKYGDPTGTYTHTDELGYVRVYCTKRGRLVGKHRLVMEEYLGRMLEPWETVHHIDLNPSNNDITNLQLRIGNHGMGAAIRCSDCGSDRIEYVELS